MPTLLLRADVVHVHGYDTLRCEMINLQVMVFLHLEAVAARILAMKSRLGLDNDELCMCRV